MLSSSCSKAKEQSIELVGPDGLLGQLTKNVLKTALDSEMSEHLGYEKHDPAGRGSGNSRNGTRAKTVLTEIGPVDIEVPRDTASTFEPQIVRKRQRPRDLQHERDLVDQRPLPTCRTSARALPKRHRRLDVPLPPHQITEPHRTRKSAPGD